MLGRDHDLPVVPAIPWKAEAIVGCGQVIQLAVHLPALESLVIEDDLGDGFLVVRGLGAAQEAFGVLLEGNNCGSEVGPVGDALADGLLGCLGVVEVPEAVQVLESVDEDWKVRLLYPLGFWISLLGCYIVEPRPTHEEIAAVVEVLGLPAESKEEGRARMEVSLHL